jgi:hypothetical protein
MMMLPGGDRPGAASGRNGEAGVVDRGCKPLPHCVRRTAATVAPSDTYSRFCG